VAPIQGVQAAFCQRSLAAAMPRLQGIEVKPLCFEIKFRLFFMHLQVNKQIAYLGNLQKMKYLENLPKLQFGDLSRCSEVNGRWSGSSNFLPSIFNGFVFCVFC
jgi:hypothetical protein